MKRTVVSAAVAASFAVTVLGATGVASAAPIHEDTALQHGQATVIEPRSISQCAVGRICVWHNPNYTGDWSSIVALHSGECLSVPGGGHSYYNDSVYTQRIFSGSNCTGTTAIVLSGVDIPENGWVVNSVGGYP
jgi:hypothetical protein